jgi:hypothetical protein
VWIVDGIVTFAEANRAVDQIYKENNLSPTTDERNNLQEFLHGVAVISHDELKKALQPRDLLRS